MMPASLWDKLLFWLNKAKIASLRLQGGLCVLHWGGATWFAPSVVGCSLSLRQMILQWRSGCGGVSSFNDGLQKTSALKGNTSREDDTAAVEESKSFSTLTHEDLTHRHRFTHYSLFVSHSLCFIDHILHWKQTKYKKGNPKSLWISANAMKMFKSKK